MTLTSSPPRLSTPRLLGYAFGEGARVVVVNGLSNFGFLFCTQALGLSAGYAGFVLSLSLLLNAFLVPVMGHVTDHTRSRWGRRLPYIVGAGFLVSLLFGVLWLAPLAGFSNHHLIAAWVFLGNLLLQLAVTIFVVPYTALGFEICPGYEERSRLQGVRAAFGMATNLLSGALAWSLFFRDRVAPDGSRIDGTTVASNYMVMGAALGLAAFFMVLLCVAATAWSAADNRSEAVPSRSVRTFLADLQAILGDRLAWCVFGFSVVVQLGVLVVMQTQIFVYVYFMRFSADAKTVAHGSGIVAYAAAALFQAWLTRRTSKKSTAIFGLAVAAAGGLFLQGIFFGLQLDPEKTVALFGWSVPVGAGLFLLGQMAWWAGIGILTPLALSMIADVSEIAFLRSGRQKDGSYAAVFTFLQKVGTAAGLLLAGWMISASGMVAGPAQQSPAAIRNVAMLTFLAGPAFILASYVFLRRYPVDRAFLIKLRGAGALDSRVKEGAEL